MRMTIRLRRGFTLLLIGMALSACNGPTVRPEGAADPLLQAPGEAPSQPGHIPSAPLDPATEIPLRRTEVVRGTGRFLRPPGNAQPPGATAEEVALDFESAELRQVIKSILGDLLSVRYTVDEAVKGRVTLHTSAPVSREALIPILETLLRMNGAALVEREGLYRVVPEATAVSGGGPPRMQALPGHGYQLLVVPLGFVAAGEMQKVLEPLKPARGFILPDTRRNLLLIAGSEAELVQLGELVRLFDVDQLAGMSFGLFPLHAVDPGTIIRELNALFGGDEGPAQLLRLVPVERLGAVLAVSPQAAYIDQARQWIERLDRADTVGEPALHIYPVQNGRAAHLAELLGRLFGLGATPGGSGSGPRSPSPLRGAEGAEAMPVAAVMPRRTNGFGEVTIVADEQNNALLVRATPADYERLQSAIERLDALPMQVLVEATIVEVQLTGDLSYGLEWFFRNRVDDYSGQGRLLSRTPGFDPSFTYSVVDSAGRIRALLELLAADSRMNVLSSPSLMVLDNHTASIRVGDQVPVRTSETTSLGTSGDAPVITSTIEFRDTGVLLTVSPRVNAGGVVVLDVSQEVSDVSSTTTSGIDSPTILQRQVNTTVAVDSGETVVLGGLIRENHRNASSGFPLLRDIPGVGLLFGAQTLSKDRTELIVLITPTAVTGRDQARAATRELRRRMRGIDWDDFNDGLGVRRAPPPGPPAEAADER